MYIFIYILIYILGWSSNHREKFKFVELFLHKAYFCPLGIDSLPVKFQPNCATFRGQPILNILLVC